MNKNPDSGLFLTQQKNKSIIVLSRENPLFGWLPQLETGNAFVTESLPKYTIFCFFTACSGEKINEVSTNRSAIYIILSVFAFWVHSLVTYLCVFTTKTYQTPSSKLRLLFYKALYSNGFNHSAYFCFLPIFFGKKKIVDWKLFALIGSITLIFAFLGGFLSSKFDAKFLKIVFAVFVFLASLLMLRPVKSGYVKSRWGLEIKSATGSYYINLLFFVPIVMVTGFISGMVGISGGSFLVPLMVLTIGVPMQIAVGTSTALVMITASAGFLGHLSIGHFDVKSSLILAFFAVIGSIIGTRLTIKANAKVLKFIFAFTSMIAAIIMLLL